MKKKTGKYVGKELEYIRQVLESDMKSAEQAGIKSILVDRRDKRDFSNKVTTLSEIPEMIKKM